MANTLNLFRNRAVGFIVFPELSAVRVGIDGSESIFVNPEAITAGKAEVVPICQKKQP
jgi:hypothetical protein